MPVQVRLAKWEDSLGLRLPSEVTARAGLREGMAVTIEASDDGRIIVTRSRHRFTLEELLAGMTSDKEHSPSGDEPQGSEII
jgi:antitoxin MazE